VERILEKSKSERHYWRDLGPVIGEALDFADSFMAANKAAKPTPVFPNSEP
jgi:hypothetical protein